MNDTLSELVKAITSLNDLVCITTASLDSLNDITEEYLQGLERFGTVEKQKELKQYQSGISEKVNTKAKIVRRKKVQLVHNEKVMEETTQIPKTEISRGDEETTGLEHWLEYKDENVVVRYNSKTVKNLKISYTIPNKRGGFDPKNSVVVGLGSSESEIKRTENLHLDDQIGLEDCKTKKEIPDQKSSNAGNDTPPADKGDNGMSAKLAKIINAGLYSFIFSTAQRYVKPGVYHEPLFIFVQKLLHRAPLPLGKQLLLKASIVQNDIGYSNYMDYREYRFYKFLCMIYEECILTDGGKECGDSSLAFVSEVLHCFWMNDGKYPHPMTPENWDKLFREVTKTLHPNKSHKENDKPKEGTGKKFFVRKRVRQPIRKWLEEISENCYDSDGRLIIDHFEYLGNAFEDVESSFLKNRARKYIDAVFMKCANLDNVKVKKVHVLNALQHVVDMCRTSDEMDGYNDLDIVFEFWSLIAPPSYSYESFVELKNAGCKAENSEEQMITQKMEEDDDKLTQVDSFKKNVERQILHRAWLEESFKFRKGPDFKENCIDPKYPKNQNTPMDIFSCIELQSNLRCKTNMSDNSETNITREWEKMHSEAESDEDRSDDEKYLGVHLPGIDVSKQIIVRHRSGPEEVDSLVKSMMKKCKGNICLEVYGVLPLEFFCCLKELAEELVSQGDFISEYYIPLFRIFEKNGLPDSCRNHSVWKTLMIRVQDCEKEESKISLVYDWLLSIMAECVRMDEGVRGSHCENLIGQLRDMNLFRDPSVASSSPTCKRNTKQGPGNPRSVQSDKSGMAAMSENRAKRRDMKTSSTVSSPTIQPAISDDSEDKMEIESLACENPFPYTLIENPCDGFVAVSSAYNEAAGWGNPQDRRVTEIQVTCKRNVSQSKERRPGKAVAEPGEDDSEENDSDKTTKTVKKTGKKEDDDAAMSAAMQADIESENKLILIKKVAKSCMNPQT